MWSSKLREFEQTESYNNVGTHEEESVTDVQSSNNELAKPADFSLKELIGYGVGLTSMMTEVLISHPFLVIRHQCQVRSRSKLFHIQPFSLMPVLQNYISHQGLFTLWKGLSGAFTVRAISIVTENLISEVFSLPKDISVYSSPRKLGFHVILKTISWVICTPFYAVAMVEFVQSDIASEPTSLISCLMEGLRRMLPMGPSTGPRLSGSLAGHLKAGLRSLPIKTSRLLPMWRLVLPVVVLCVGQHIVRTTVCSLATTYLDKHSVSDEPELTDAETEVRTRVGRHSPMNPGGGDGHWNDSSTDLTYIQTQRQETALQNTYIRYCTELTANMWGCLIADVLLYPLETIVVRLCVQGTRTLVDNLDSGVSVLPIVSSFDGPIDVFRYSLHSPAGITGLYRGFGALLLQYAIQWGFLIGVKYVYEQLLCHYSSYIPIASQAPPFRSDRLSVPPIQQQQQLQQSPPPPPPPPTLPPMTDPSRSVWRPITDQQRWRSDSLSQSVDGRESGFVPLQPPTQLPQTTFRGYSNIYDQPI